MKKYRLSKYNFFYQKGESVVGLNLYNKYLFSLDKDKYNILCQHKSSLEVFQQNHPSFFGAMYKLGVIEDVNLNIPQILLMKNRREVFSEDIYHLAINTTLNCNFSCWYCYETRSKRKMTTEVRDAIIKFIEKRMSINKTKFFKIDWFGGEPLMAYKNVIKPISEELNVLCEKYGARYVAGITTNGYLITPSLIADFTKYNIHTFQITLDGYKEHHNKTRFQVKGKDSYDIIVKNVIDLAKSIPNIDLYLRINFTKDILDDCLKIRDSFPMNIRKRIIINLVQVWQDQSADKNRDETLKRYHEVNNIFRDSGFRILNLRHSYMQSCSCYADKYNEAIVNYDGRIFKCSTQNFEEATEDGGITPEGEIVWDEDRLSKRIARATFDNEICLNCKYVPLCSGRCSQRMLEVNFKGPKNCPKKKIFNKKIKDDLKDFSSLNLKMLHINQLYSRIL